MRRLQTLPILATVAVSVAWLVLGVAGAQSVPTEVGPIAAVFDGPEQTTTYRVNVGPNVEVTAIDWSGPNCGAFEQSTTDPEVFVWHHPHPPCDSSRSHDNTTIVAAVRIGSMLARCSYQGAETGSGSTCPVTTQAGTAGGGGTTTGGAEDDGGSGLPSIFVLVLILLVGLLLTLLGVRLFMGGRTQPRPGSPEWPLGTDEDEEDDEEEEEDEEDPRDAPPPAIYGEEVGYGRYSYRLELRHWRAWTHLLGLVSAKEGVTFESFDFSKDPWLCQYEGLAETFLVVRGEFVNAPGKEASIDVVRVGAVEDKQAKRFTKRFTISRDSRAVSETQKPQLKDRFTDRYLNWKAAPAVSRFVAYIGGANIHDRNERQSYASTKWETDYRDLTQSASWRLHQNIGSEQAVKMRFKVIAVWSVVFSQPPPDKLWQKYADAVGRLVMAELAGKVESAVKAATGKIGEIAIDAAKEVAAGGDEEQQLAGATTYLWRRVPRSYLPVLTTYPTSPEKAPYRTPPEAWVKATNTKKGHNGPLLAEKVDDLWGTFNPLRWQLRVEMDARLHIDETFHPKTAVPKNL